MPCESVQFSPTWLMYIFLDHFEWKRKVTAVRNSGLIFYPKNPSILILKIVKAIEGKESLESRVQCGISESEEHISYLHFALSFAVLSVWDFHLPLPHFHLPLPHSHLFSLRYSLSLNWIARNLARNHYFPQSVLYPADGRLLSRPSTAVFTD